MTFFILIALLVVVSLWHYNRDLARTAEGLVKRGAARRDHVDKPDLQYPHIDLSRCFGCGCCVKACIHDVLGIVHGQAIMLKGGKCVGCGFCTINCPVSAIDMALADTQGRKDIPNLYANKESTQIPNLFLGGEITGHGLIRTAIEHGTNVAKEVASRTTANALKDDEWGILDLFIVGAGPAGLAASLQAQESGLLFATVDHQRNVGGLITSYPQQEFLTINPIVLPGYGELKKTYARDEFLELLESLVEEKNLSISLNEEFLDFKWNEAEGVFHIKTTFNRYVCRHLLLAIGRSGTPRRLNVPGEELQGVEYDFVHPGDFKGRDVLVAGGGNVAVETAMELSQAGAMVTLIHSRPAFVPPNEACAGRKCITCRRACLTEENYDAIHKAVETGSILCHLNSKVLEIESGAVRIAEKKGSESVVTAQRVLVREGGVAPFRFLKSLGLSFNPGEHHHIAVPRDRGAGMVTAFVAVLVCAVLAGTWFWIYRDYYCSPFVDRGLSRLHDSLRPSKGWGLTFGITGTILTIANLLYLVRRFTNWRNWHSSLRKWMIVHEVGGLLAPVLLLMHAAYVPLNTLGGHALYAMALLAITGAVGRYLYPLLPSGINEGEDMLELLKKSLADQIDYLEEAGVTIGSEAYDHIRSILEEQRWTGNPFSRMGALFLAKRRIRRTSKAMAAHFDEAAGGTAKEFCRDLERVYSGAVVVSHFEDFRAIVSTWRFFHRWLAILMVILATLHITYGFWYGRIFG